MGMISNKSRLLADIATKNSGARVYNNVGIIKITYKTKERALEDAYRNNIQDWLQKRAQLQKMPPEQHRKGLSGLARDIINQRPNGGKSPAKGVWLPNGTSTFGGFSQSRGYKSWRDFQNAKRSR